MRGLWSLQKTYGGIEHVFGAPKTAQFPYHDQFGRADYVAAGVGASYSMSDAVDLFFVCERMLHGRNGHKLDFSATIGVIWTFAAARRHGMGGASCSMPSEN